VTHDATFLRSVPEGRSAMSCRIALLFIIVSQTVPSTESLPVAYRTRRDSTQKSLTYESLSASSVTLRWDADGRALGSGCFSISYQKGSGKTESRMSCDSKNTYELLGLGKMQSVKDNSLKVLANISFQSQIQITISGFRKIIGLRTQSVYILMLPSHQG